MTRMTRDAQQRALDEVYAQIPRIECRGECWDSCGPIQMTRVEQQRMAVRQGKTLPLLSKARRCPMLGMFGQCTVYDDRPLICRLWGVVPSMQCNFGCVPEGGLLSERAGHLLIARAMEISGDHAGAEKTRALWADPATAAWSEAFINQREKERKRAWTRNRDASERDGSALYVDRMGRVSRHRSERAHD